MFNQIFMSQIMLRRLKLTDAIQELLLENPDGLTRNEIFHGVDMDISSDQLTNALTALMTENIVKRSSRRSVQRHGEKPVCIYVAIQHSVIPVQPTPKGRPRQTETTSNL